MNAKTSRKNKETTLEKAEEFKRVSGAVVRWIQSIPRAELTELAVAADKEVAVFDSLKSFVECIMHCNDAVVSRLATQMLSDVVYGAGTKSAAPAKKIVKSKRKKRNAR